MKTIWKFTLQMVARQDISMPMGAKILPKIDMQGVNLVLWAEVDDIVETTVPRHLCIVGTGMEMPSGNLAYIDTVLHSGYVWHLYEKLP